MRRIINFLLTLAVFWAASNWFGQYVHIEGTQTLILAALFMEVANVILGFVFLGLMLTSIIPVVGCFTILAIFCLAFVVTPIKLWLLCTYLPGFSINGLIAYVLLTIAIGIFSIEIKNTNSSK